MQSKKLRRPVGCNVLFQNGSRVRKIFLSLTRKTSKIQKSAKIFTHAFFLLEMKRNYIYVLDFH